MLATLNLSVDVGSDEDPLGFWTLKNVIASRLAMVPMPASTRTAAMHFPAELCLTSVVALRPAAFDQIPPRLTALSVFPQQSPNFPCRNRYGWSSADLFPHLVWFLQKPLNPHHAKKMSPFLLYV